MISIDKAYKHNSAAERKYSMMMNGPYLQRLDVTIAHWIWLIKYTSQSEIYGFGSPASQWSTEQC